ncbi:uncharacterized protein MAM_06142 [Metarhizium album ARSEF 1941]|uniref:DUF2418 domain-containing protein n=1 Tax=Metarhizium album (strain ARSEF 1941) TaxID=1081103 RepID=A0A0B2WRB2_METAS|nr:uncharacterized protein MAM_06142 [Metarhizium album ARSEF 1941]KHN96037.1 hypothetical protein MAM_06142 [Metarhizium album ARSEF 1941]
MPRLVRRRPLWDRMTSMLNPMDFLLWLSEEIETRDWDSGLVGTQLGLGLNFLFLLARANSGSKQASDEIFGDESPSRWLSVLVYPLSWGLMVFSIVNAVYTVTRTRKYRLFEARIDVKPSTSSVRRVKIQSSPVASSPLRYIADMIASDSAESRAHPDKSRDVWELSIWDPLPVCIRLACLFSPGHVLVYLIFLPLAPLDPRPSVTVFNSLIMQVVLSTQMLLLSSRYSQQSKDSAIVQKEVFHEYDTKFVQPRIHPIVRDAGTQMSEDQPAISREFVQVGTPTTLIRRSFISHGNPHVDSEEATPIRGFYNSNVSSGNVMRPQMFTPSTVGRRTELFTPAVSSHRYPGIRHSLPAGHTPSSTTPPSYTPAPPSTSTMGTSTGVNANFGGSLCLSSHQKSPLKKAMSMGDMNSDNILPGSPTEVAYDQRGQEPPSSPTKYSENRRFTGMNINSSPHPFANMDMPDKIQEQRSPEVDQSQVNTAAISSSASQSESITELQLVQKKKEARRLRRNLKQSGDYLGVQGFNPETGQLDVMTSTDSDRSSSLSQETQKKLLILRNTLRDARHSYTSAKEKRENEGKKILWKNEKEKLRRLEKDKEEVKDINKTVKWKRHARQWSSAQEPDLSPIAQSVIGTAGSSLVKTPHGQSLADPAEFGSSAWELFVNGISFESSEEPVPANDLDSGLESREMLHPKHHENVEKPASGRKSNNCDPTPSTAMREQGNRSDENIEHHDHHGSFLGMRRQRGEEPRGETQIISLAALTSKLANPSILSPKQELNHNVVNHSIQYKQDRRGMALNHGEREEEAQSSSTVTTEQVLRRRQSKGIQPPQGEPVTLTGARGKLIQNWGHWISRRRGTRRSGTNQDDTAHMQNLQPSQAGHPSTALEVVPQIPDSWATDLTSKRGLQIFAHKPETNPGMKTQATTHWQTGEEVEEQHRPFPTAGTDKDINKDILNREKCESVAWKDARTKQPVPVGYACTPITITTGCGQQHFQAKPRRNTQPNTESHSSLRLERHLSGVASDLPLAARSGLNSGAGATKPLQNQLLRVGHANRGIETDTTSKARRMAKDKSIQKSTGAVAKIGTTARTDVVGSKPEDVVSASEAEIGLKKLVVHDLEKRSKVVSETSNKCEANDTNRGTEHKGVIQEQVGPVVQRDEPDELSDMGHAPGSFPGTKVGDTGGDGCEGSSDGNGKGAGIPLMAVKEHLEMVRCHLLAFFLLYWDIVGPVFDSGSEYWERNRRHESTLADCFALVVALPGAILAVMGLV